jgi:hypothetical protein
VLAKDIGHFQAMLRHDCCAGIEKPECADDLDVSGLRHSFLFDEEQLIATNVLGFELIGWFGEVPSELGDDMQVNPDSGGRVMTNLEILQHPLSKWGHKKTPFVVATPQTVLDLPEA